MKHNCKDFKKAISDPPEHDNIQLKSGIWFFNKEPLAVDMDSIKFCPFCGVKIDQKNLDIKIIKE